MKTYDFKFNNEEDLKKHSYTNTAHGILTNNFSYYPDVEAMFTEQPFGITVHQSEKLIDKDWQKYDNSVKYLYNSMGFRCDEFKKEHSETHILFSGCSETEGVGDNIENNWSYLLFNKINQKIKTTGYFNLGKSSSGFNRIINDVIVYMQKYGKPDIIFILFPNIARWTEWVSNDVGYKSIGVAPNNNKKEKVDIDTTSIKQQRDLILQFILLIRLLELYCKDNHIKLYWSSWDVAEENNYNNLQSINSFNRFVNFNLELFINKILKETVEQEKIIKEKNYILRRDGHLGQVFHNHFSEKFFNYFIEENNNAKI